MPEQRFVLAIDQGTTSSRAILFDADGKPTAVAQKELPQIFPEPGWVEHDARVIWRDTLAVSRQALRQAGVEAQVLAAIGITNQRETTVLWHRGTGEPIANAIVWQDRRTAAACDTLRSDGHATAIQAKTGLVLDPYFSATKVAWLLDNVPGARAEAEAGNVAFGTIDSWLLWQLTGGAVHATDATNAARTMLFNIHEQHWDDDLLRLFNVPQHILPEVRDCSGDFGLSQPEHLGAAVAVRGMAGDQQAAAFGQACFEPGMLKSTYGTGCFALINTGREAITSDNQLLTTVAYRLGDDVRYALEGSIFVAGAAIQWLRDGLALIKHAEETEALAGAIASTGGVYMVPAFVGLGAPYWDADARGAIIGLTRDSGTEEIVRAAIESVAYQTRDLMQAMAADAGQPATALRVDGGMVANNWLLQFLADVVDLPVERPVVTETTALGAAYLAGLAAGIFPSLDELGQKWQRGARFEPQMSDGERDGLYAGWQHAVSRVLTNK